jgi:hypothetical protein
MVLLSENLDVDLGLISSNDMFLNSLNSSISPDGTRLWAKHFSPYGDLGGIRVPRCWSDFLTLSLLHPLRFDWTKAFLESKA